MCAYDYILHIVLLMLSFDILSIFRLAELLADSSKTYIRLRDRDAMVLDILVCFDNNPRLCGCMNKDLCAQRALRNETIKANGSRIRTTAKKKFDMHHFHSLFAIVK